MPLDGWARDGWIRALATFLGLVLLFGNGNTVLAANEECGKQAPVPGTLCPLNVCCSQWGFCGTTPEFCDVSQNCQSNCGPPPASTGQAPGDVKDLVIGYFESWSLLRRGCANRDISSIRYDSLTHINVAFGYIKPNTYEVYPIHGASIAGFKSVTNLKQHAPGLNVWLSLGGWDFSDNGTDTQPVWGDLASTPSKRSKFIAELIKFMSEWGFDGVDIDWEYPGAPDRHGHPEDVKNFNLLMAAIKGEFTNMRKGWGLSFTAPASYWYMKWFDIKTLSGTVDWINLMTYDLHGSWDNQSDWIGPHIYAHTNLTEIKDALTLLWRNDVPANRVNLGLGFYGRSYTLADPACNKPGCPFSAPGNAGTCSGTAGYMTYQDISRHLKETGIKPVYDEVAAVQYFQYDRDQWISYDSAKSIQQKVDFANKAGLLGLFIWAIDQDTYDWELLNAVLQPDGLGKFKKRNGAGNDGGTWSHNNPSTCRWSACGGSGCGPGEIEIQNARCRVDKDGHGPYKHLCCPLDNAPDPDFCRWRIDGAVGTLFCDGSQSCPEGEVNIADSTWFRRPDGSDAACLTGQANYCCDIEQTGEKLCKWSSERDFCFEIDPKTNKPVESYVCAGQKFITYRPGNCDTSKRMWDVLCCQNTIDPECHWSGSNGQCNVGCSNEEVKLTESTFGGGRECVASHGACPAGICVGPGGPQLQSLCCKRDKLKLTVKTLPVPLANLGPGWDKIPSSDKQTFDIDVDTTRNGANDDTDTDPNRNGFGWHIMSGPESEITTLDKRDGSDWEVYDCDPAMHEGVQTAKLVCTTEGSEGSNCDVIHQGRGVAETVVQMPPGCGPGKYAMAVSLKPLVDEKIPHRLVKRGVSRHATVHEFTFDYNFAILHGRQDSNVRLRIDYSDDPGYWGKIVAPPGRMKKRSMEQLQEEVDRDHAGSWERYLDHTWRLDRRSTPPDQLHELHERWFSATLVDWLDRHSDVEYSYDGLRHTINRIFDITILDQSKVCPRASIHAKIWAELLVNIETSAILTLIGSLRDLNSFDQSHINFRNKGIVKATLFFDAEAEIRLSTGQKEIIGIAPLGATFKIPGLVTIGPEFKIIGELSAQVTMHADAAIEVNLAEWDYSQRYPYPANEGAVNEKKKKMPDGTTAGSANTGGKGAVQFTYDINAEGAIEAHLMPQITFGVVWDSRWPVPNAAIDVGVDGMARIYANVGSSSANAWHYCYGVDVGYEIYGRIQAPTLFGTNLPLTNQRLSLYPPKRVPIYGPKCNT